jgi:hypothetical protein
MKMLLLVTLTLASSTTVAPAQDHAAHTTQPKSLAQAFDHYEGVRAALAADKLSDAGPHAKQLSSSLEAVGASDVRKHADLLAAATTLEDARKHFGELSVILVPRFQAEKIEGANAFMCAMKKQPWIQKGEKVENPYYGKAMLTCGSPIAGKKEPVRRD